jgi:hypothetical protein
MNGNWNFLGIGFFGTQVQRRGVHVNIPKIGSRVGAFCFGENLGFCAELRRELRGGNWNLGTFWGLGGSPRRCTEEGGPFMCQFVYLGEFVVLLVVGFVDSFNTLQGELWPICAKVCEKGEVRYAKGRPIELRMPRGEGFYLRCAAGLSVT